jgi:hypothetical protein
MQLRRRTSALREQEPPAPVIQTSVAAGPGLIFAGNAPVSCDSRLHSKGFDQPHVIVQQTLYHLLAPVVFMSNNHIRFAFQS